MFKVIVGLADQREIEVKFVHHNPNGKDNIHDPLTQLLGTECLIYRHGSLAGNGRAFLHPLDYNSYCKETGRKIALAQALKNFGFNKMKRTQVWKAYFAVQNEARELALTQGMIAL